MSASSDHRVHQVQMGLGAAIQRLTTLEFQVRMGGAISPAVDLERKLLLEALDHFVLEVGFDTDGDGLPDTVEVFKAAALAGHRVVNPRQAPSPELTPGNPVSEEATLPTQETMPEKKRRQPLTKFLGSLFRWRS